MPPSRGFMSVLAVIIFVIAIGFVAVWWVDQQQTASLHAGSQPSQDLLAGPTTGIAPLTVAFSVRRDLGTVEMLDYGDGTSAHTADFICGFEYCVKNYIYDQPGTYTARYADASGATLQSFVITVQAAP